MSFLAASWGLWPFMEGWEAVRLFFLPLLLLLLLFFFFFLSFFLFSFFFFSNFFLFFSNLIIYLCPIFCVCGLVLFFINCSYTRKKTKQAHTDTHIQRVKWIQRKSKCKTKTKKDRCFSIEMPQVVMLTLLRRCPPLGRGCSPSQGLHPHWFIHVSPWTSKHQHYSSLEILSSRISYRETDSQKL